MAAPRAGDQIPVYVLVLGRGRSACTTSWARCRRAIRARTRCRRGDLAGGAPRRLRKPRGSKRPNSFTMPMGAEALTEAPDTVTPVPIASCTWADRIIGHSVPDCHSRRSHVRMCSWAASVNGACKSDRTVLFSMERAMRYLHRPSGLRHAEKPSANPPGPANRSTTGTLRVTDHPRPVRRHRNRKLCRLARLRRGRRRNGAEQHSPVRAHRRSPPSSSITIGSLSCRLLSTVPFDERAGTTMADIVDRATRSRMMAGIGSRNTRPELALRRAVHARGLRYRLHDRRLPGTPDLVFRQFSAVCLVQRHSQKFGYAVLASR